MLDLEYKKRTLRRSFSSYKDAPTKRESMACGNFKLTSKEIEDVMTKSIIRHHLPTCCHPHLFEFKDEHCVVKKTKNAIEAPFQK